MSSLQFQPVRLIRVLSAATFGLVVWGAGSLSAEEVHVGAVSGYEIECDQRSDEIAIGSIDCTLPNTDTSINLRREVFAAAQKLSEGIITESSAMWIVGLAEAGGETDGSCRGGATPGMGGGGAAAVVVAARDPGMLPRGYDPAGKFVLPDLDLPDDSHNPFIAIETTAPTDCLAGPDSTGAVGRRPLRVTR